MTIISSSNTAERILDVTQDLIQRRGYNSITFEDISKIVGIKKPSIVHHYPSKAALGKAVVHRYSNNFSAALKKFKKSPGNNASDALEFYFLPYIDFGETEDKICLCGSLAGEFTALPLEMQEEVTIFFQEHQNWLESILTWGKENGEFQFDGNPQITAKLILDSLQGALIVKRATGNNGHVREIVHFLKANLGVH